LEETKTVMKGLTEALAHMHKRKIMHRDLKPENIIFKKPGTFFLPKY
jgi:calcium-dependent protein kinase